MMMMMIHMHIHIHIIYFRSRSGPSVTIFIEFDKEKQLIEGIGELISDSGIDGAFMLNKISSEKWCVLVVTHQTTYLDPIKSHLEECLGSEKDVLERGVHFYVEVSYANITWVSVKLPHWKVLFQYNCKTG